MKHRREASCPAAGSRTTTTAAAVFVVFVVAVAVSISLLLSDTCFVFASASAVSAAEEEVEDTCENNAFCDPDNVSDGDGGVGVGAAGKQEGGTTNNYKGLFDFLKDNVFGQKDANHNDDNDPSSSSSSTPFFSIHTDIHDRHKNKNNNANDNPFLSFISDIKHTRDSLFGTGTGTGSKSTGNDDNDDDTNNTDSIKDEHSLIPQLLDRARQLVQEEEAVGGMEMFDRIRTAIRQVAQQVKDTFGNVVVDANVDAGGALSLFAIPYYAEHEDQKKGPLWKRKRHRFYEKVTKHELRDLHDGLYLSHLAYVDTVEQFVSGLEQFSNGDWKMLYGTTTSLPTLPASFLIIHKQLAPLEEDTNHRPIPLLPIVDYFTNNINNSKKTKGNSNSNSNTRSNEEIVVVTMVVRGTKELTDVLADGTLDPIPYKGGYVHGGILAGGINLAKYYLPKLEELHLATKRKQIRLVIIGHSLGAGTAAIAAMELQDHDFLQVEAIGFGCPALLSKELSLSTKDYITTVIHDADIIPRMSGASITNLLYDLLEYDWTDDAIEDLKFSLQRGRDYLDFGRFLPDTDTVVTWVGEYLNKTVRPKFYDDDTENEGDDRDGSDNDNTVMEENSRKKKKKKRRDRIPNLLIPPGRCIHIFRDGYGCTATYTPCDEFAAVDFSVTLIDDHLIPTGYHRGLLSAAQDSDRDYTFQFSNDILGIVGV